MPFLCVREKETSAKYNRNKDRKRTSIQNAHAEKWKTIARRRMKFSKVYFVAFSANKRNGRCAKKRMWDSKRSWHWKSVLFCSLSMHVQFGALCSLKSPQNILHLDVDDDDDDDGWNILCSMARANKHEPNEVSKKKKKVLLTMQ